MQNRERLIQGPRQTPRFGHCLKACNNCHKACTAAAHACIESPQVKRLMRCIMLNRDCGLFCNTAGNSTNKGSTAVPVQSGNHPQRSGAHQSISGNGRDGQAFLRLRLPRLAAHRGHRNDRYGDSVSGHRPGKLPLSSRTTISANNASRT